MLYRISWVPQELCCIQIQGARVSGLLDVRLNYEVIRTGGAHTVQ